MSIHDKHYVVISACKKDCTDKENSKLKADLLQDIFSLVKFDTSVQNVIGKYKGRTEESFAVIMPDDDTAFSRIQQGLLDLGEKYEQEHLLLVYGQYDPPTAAYFHLLNSTSEDADEYIEHPWIQISYEEAMDVDTVIYINGRYYVMNESEDVTPWFIELAELESFK